jgi:hypothetical protein
MSETNEATELNEHNAYWVECWQCSGDGVTYSCFEEYACIDPEGGCDDCERRCDICRGKHGWWRSFSDTAPSELSPSQETEE